MAHTTRSSRLQDARIAVVPNMVRNSIIRRNVDLLQNIEFILCEAGRIDESVDDGIVFDAVIAAIQRRMPDREKSRQVADALSEVRAARPEPGSDKLWRDALCVVAESIKNHSTLDDGDTGYLDFAMMYVQ